MGNLLKGGDLYFNNGLMSYKSISYDSINVYDSRIVTH
jgi:hypothetical protein